MKTQIVILLCFLATAARAQDLAKNDRSFLNLAEFKVGYSGNFLWQNGLVVGAEYPWKEKIKVKEKKRGNKTITQQILLNGNLGITTNFFSKTDTGAFTNYGLIFRRTNHKGRQIGITFNPLGYYRSFLPETYEVKGNSVEKISLPGRGYYSPSLAVGIGKLRKDKRRSGWYLNLNFMLRTPYNAGILPSVALQYGYRFKFKKQ